MKNWLAQHSHALSSSLRRLASAPLSTLLNVLVIGIALSLPAGLYVLLQNVQQIADRAASAPQVSVFLSLSATKEDVEQVGRRLKQSAAVDHADFVPREAALEQLRQTTGLADVIGGLTQNPLPDAYVVHPRKIDAQALEALRDEIQKWPRVEHAQLDSGWARKLDALLQFGRTATLLLVALLGSALLAVTFNTIRLQILTRREEIAVAKLIGATDGFIRRPFLYFGLLQGLAGGASAWLIIAGGMHLLAGSLAGLMQLYGSGFALYPPSISDGAMLLLFSASLGWLGAWLSVGQHLRRMALN